MIEQGTPGAIINTGSKQGITTPPGDTAYNVSKAGVKVLTEAVAHELRNIDRCRITAHLLIPGFTFTGITGRAEKPTDAWSAEQVVDFMIDAMGNGDFYILCPDMRSRGRWMKSVFSGPQKISSKTAQRCLDGTPTTKMLFSAYDGAAKVGPRNLRRDALRPPFMAVMDLLANPVTVAGAVSLDVDMPVTGVRRVRTGPQNGCEPTACSGSQRC